MCHHNVNMHTGYLFGPVIGPVVVENEVVSFSNQQTTKIHERSCRALIRRSNIS